MSSPPASAWSGVGAEPAVFPPGIEPSLHFDTDTAEHFVQFFEDDSVLVDSLEEFVVAGLSGGEASILVGRPSRLDAVRERLAARGSEDAITDGQVVLVDANELLDLFVIDDFVDRRRFHELATGLLDDALERFPRVRVFGEMVAILWISGRRRAAIELEEQWNALQQERAFTLFCAYPFREMTGADSALPFEKVCRAHSHVVPPESYARLDRPEERLRTIVEWQQKAQLLELEVRERKSAERALHAVKEELEQQVEDLRLLHELSARLNGNADESSVLEVVLGGALAVEHTDMGLLYLCESPCDGLWLKAHRGLDRDFVHDMSSVAIGTGTCGAALAERRRIIVEDIATDARFADSREAARRAGFRACHCTPLITRAGKILGVLSVHFRQPHAVSERESRLMDLFSQMAANAIENANLHRRAQHEIEERQTLLRRERDARAVVESASRLKDEFLATVSHELRTPLTAIIGWAHMLREDSLTPEVTARAVETIERAATSQAQLIEDILDVSRIITGNMTLTVAPLDPVPIVEAAVSALRVAATSKSIDLSIVADTSVRRGDQPILGDARRLQQVVWNLVSNAIKFTPHGGLVTVRLVRDATDFEVEVADSGEGLEPEFLPHLFERFRQADGSSSRRHQGLGLGLAIVRHLIELHGGTINARSDGKGRGATFNFRLPLMAKSAARLPVVVPTPARAASARVAQLEGLKILIVDNDPDTLEMLEAVLEEQRADVRTASSAAEAFEILRSYEANVIVSDLAMPDQDGYAFIRALRAREGAPEQHIPAIALTAHVRVEDRRAALEAGFQMFVPKPLEPAELVSTIANLAWRVPAASELRSSAPTT